MPRRKDSRQLSQRVITDGNCRRGGIGPPRGWHCHRFNRLEETVEETACELFVGHGGAVDSGAAAGRGDPAFGVHLLSR